MHGTCGDSEVIQIQHYTYSEDHIAINLSTVYIESILAAYMGKLKFSCFNWKVIVYFSTLFLCRFTS